VSLPAERQGGKLVFKLSNGATIDTSRSADGRLELSLAKPGAAGGSAALFPIEH